MIQLHNAAVWGYSSLWWPDLNIAILFFISLFLLQQVVDMMLRMRREMAGREPQIPPQIDNLLILDRNVDLLTPLLSQLTYEGLIDEIFGLSNSK